MFIGMLSADAFLLIIISTIIVHCNGAPTGYTITLKQYTTIKIGWTQQQVTQLLGGPGTIVAQSGKPGSAHQVTLVRYPGVKSSKSFASFTFTGTSLDTKAQTGLDTGTYTITQQQYTAIQIGWTRKQVTNLVGSQGNTVEKLARVILLLLLSNIPWLEQPTACSLRICRWKRCLEI